MNKPGDSLDRDALLVRIDESTRAMRRDIQEIKTNYVTLAEFIPVKKQSVTRAEFDPVRSVVYGMVAFSLIALLGGIISLVVITGGHY